MNERVSGVGPTHGRMHRRWTSGGRRSSGASGRSGRPKMSDIRSFSSGAGGSVVQWLRSSVALGVVGRLVLVGVPAAVTFVSLVSLDWRDLQGPDVRAGPVVRWLSDVRALSLPSSSSSCSSRLVSSPSCPMLVAVPWPSSWLLDMHSTHI